MRQFLNNFSKRQISLQTITKAVKRTMSQKVSSRSNSYVSIALNDPATPTTRTRKFGFIFRRNASDIAPKNEAGQKKKSDEIVRLLGLAKPERWKLFGAICLLFVSSAVTMAVPFSLGKVLDIIYISSGDVDIARSKLNRLCGILVAVFCLGAVCNFGRVYIMSTAGYRMTQALRLKVFSSVLKQEQAFFDVRPTGELVNRLSADTQIVGQALSSNISDGLRSTIMVIAGSGMMFYMSPELALVGLAIVPPIAGAAVVYGRFVRKITREVQDSLADATNIAEERIGNIRTVRTFAQEAKEMDSYKHKIEKILKLGYSESRARAIFYGLTGLSGNIIIISVLYYGGVMVSSSTITVGNLSSFLLYAAYIGVSVGGLSSFYSELNKSVGAATRLWELVDRQPEIPIQSGFTPIAPPLGHIEFRSISFAYPSRPDISVLTDLSLSINPGQTVAVVGASGSGKSTLASLLLRLYDPGSGSVLIDGNHVKDLNPMWIRKNIGTVSQEPILFSTSIRENILYGAETPELVTDEQFLRVSKEANVHEFVRLLPTGYETKVGERGVMLSGGQKQRVAIARALMKDPKILLLDEATSALDSQSEYLVREALERVMKNRTVLTIAHRLSTIKSADVIAVLKGGQIVELGSYSELSAIDNGAFRDLIKHQTFQETMSVQTQSPVTTPLSQRSTSTSVDEKDKEASATVV